MFIVRNTTTNEVYGQTATKEPLTYVKLNVPFVVEETDEKIVMYKGKYYKQSDVPTPTAEELTAYYTALLQRHLDETAYAYGYTGIDEGIPGACNSVCTYENTGVQKFDDEGRAFKIWRSAVWAKSYEILDLVKKGAMAIPTEEELIAMLPKLEVIYTV